VYECFSLVFVVCCVGIGLCDELIIRKEEFYSVRVYIYTEFRVTYKPGKRSVLGPIRAVAQQKE
jgi:hypothetical protein